MKTTFTLAAIAALSLASTSSLPAAGTWDLRTDWSNTNNPNGVWSYRAGSLVLPYVAHWALWPDVSGWGPALPFWFRSPYSLSSDWQQGDIIVHTQDDYNGAGYGPANVTWTSPIAGRVDISGAVWMAADTGSIGGGLRGNRWNLYVRGSLISTGTIGGGDPYNRTNPFRFELGTGGPAVLDDLQVSVGDVVMLELVRTSLDGYFVGVNLTITEETNRRPNLRIRVSQVDLCWDTDTNAWYQLEYRSTLTTNQWVPFTTNWYRGDGGTFCTNDAVLPGQSQRYYRVALTNSPPQP